MNHFINTSAVDPTKARTPTLISTTPQDFPVLFFGDTRTHKFFFHDNGTIESFSGATGYTLRVTAGDANAAPFGGTFTVACGGTTPALASDISASDLEAQLNALSTILAEGGVTVTGQMPTFIVYAKTVGVRSDITANAALLSPNSAVTIEVLTTGTGSVRQEWRISVRRNVICSDDTWTQITSPNNGWSGTFTTNTESALALLVKEGEEVGGLLQAQTTITIEVLDLSGNPVSYFQMPVLLRAKPTDLAATAATPMSSYQPLNATLSAISATNDLSGVTVDGTNGVGFRNIPSNPKSANYTTVLTDAGKSIDHPLSDANARTFTIDSNANVPYPDGSCISFSNMSANNLTIAVTSDAMYLAGSGSTGNRTLAQFGTATARWMAGVGWLISGVGLT